MENIEKINKIAAKEVEIQNKTSEIIERKTKFKMQIAKLMDKFEQSQNALKDELNTLIQEHDSMLDDTLTVNLYDFVKELSKQYGIVDAKVALNIWMNRSSNITKQQLIESINNEERLSARLRIVLPSISKQIEFRYLNVFISKRDAININDVAMNIYIRDESKQLASSKVMNINYDLENVMVVVPIKEVIAEDERSKNALFNCAANEVKDKPKTLIK